MVSRVVETKLLLTGQDAASKTFDQVAKAAGGVSKAFDQVAKAGKASAEVDRLTKAVDRQAQALRQVEEQRRAASARASADMSHRLAVSRMGDVTRALDAARKAQKAFDDARKGSKTADDVAKAQQHTRAVADLTEKHRAAMRVQREAAGTLRIHSEALDRARAATRGYGLPIMDLDRHQQALKKSIEATTGAIKRQQEAERNAAEAHHRRRLQEDARLQRRADRRQAVGAVAAAGGVVAAHGGKEVVRDAISAVKEFDDATLRQRAYTDVSVESQVKLQEQAKRIGQQTQFTNADVVRAQTAAMQGLPAFSSEVRAEIGEGIVENVRNFATLMETDLKEGSETIRSYLQTMQKDISTKDKALEESRKATNQLVKMAKLGGMSGDDVSQYVKYSAASGTVAGLSSETLMTLGALARRSGLRGDEAGVFVRSASSKLVAPTQKGRSALNAAGIDYDRFVRMPDRLDTAALERQFQSDVGKSFTPAVRARVDKINTDKSLISDREKYIEAVTSAVGPILDKKKDGSVRASESQIAAKATGNYYKFAASSVDTEGLLREILGGKMTLAQLNAFFTDKQGGKAALTQSQYDEFRTVFGELQKAGEDPDFAKKRADLIMSGVAGSLENLKGSYENFTLEIGRANEGLIKFTADGLGKALDSFSKLDTTTQQLVSVGGGLVVALGGAASGIVLLKNVLGVGGLGTSAGALTGSATALATSAAALDAAAVKLAGGWPGAGVVGGAAEGAKQTKRQSLGKRLFKVGGRLIMAYSLYEAVKLASQMAEDADPSGVTNDAASDPMLMTGGAGGFAGRVATRTMSHLKETALRDAKRNALDAGLDTLSGLSLPGAIVKAIPLPDARDQGAEIGKAAGSGIANGVKEKAPEVLEQGKSIYEGLQNIFRDPLSIPMNFTPHSGSSGGGGGIIRASYGGDGGASEFVRRAGGGIDLGGTSAGVAEAFSGSVRALPIGEGTGEGHVASRAARAAYIREAARQRGIDADTALRVAQSEGFDRRIGDRGQSFGDFQLYTGGGLGNEAEAAGVDVRDPNKWREQIDFALDHAKKNGWGKFHGAGRVGIGPRQGIGVGALPKGVTDLSGLSNFRGGELRDANGFVIHHTGGRGTAAGVVATLNQRGLGVHYVMGRDGRIYRTLPEGSRGAHMRPSRSGLSNRNTIGVEIIARDDKDVTPEQIESAKRFYRDLRQRHPGIRPYGHGELNSHKQRTEGSTVTDALRREDEAKPVGELPAAPPPLPAPPPGGIGGARGDVEMLRASAEMRDAVREFAAMRLNAMLQVELTGAGRDQARVKGMQATGGGPVTADMGISMPQTRATRPA